MRRRVRDTGGHVEVNDLQALPLGVPALTCSVAPPAAEAEAEASFGLGSAARDRLRGLVARVESS